MPCNYNSENSRQSGNALIYIIIAIALIGFLTVTLTGQSNQAENQTIDDETAELAALELIEYAQAAKSVVEQMQITGSSFTALDTINPASAPYATAPHIHKIFHPQGGGLAFKRTSDFASGVFLSTTGWNFSKGTHVEWTKTTATDLIFTAMDINQTVCEKINDKFRSDLTAPADATTVTIAALFSESAATNLTATNCAQCEGYPSLCVEDSAGDFAFYNILIGR